jgi:hypothetical protein
MRVSLSVLASVRTVSPCLWFLAKKNLGDHPNRRKPVKVILFEFPVSF